MVHETLPFNEMMINARFRVQDIHILHETMYFMDGTAPRMFMSLPDDHDHDHRDDDDG